MRTLETIIVAGVVALGTVSSSAAAAPAKKTQAKVAKVSAVNKPRAVRQVQVPDAIHLDQAPNGVNGFFSDPDCQLCGTGQQSITDNFVVNEPGGAFRLEQIDIWGGYFPGNTPNPTDSFTILIHNDSGGTPGTVVFNLAGVQADTRVTTGVILFGVDEYHFTFVLAGQPVLPNGTYWVEIFNTTAGNGGVDFFWETGDLDATHGIADSLFAVEVPGATWNPNPGELSVQFNGTSVPVELQGFDIQ